MSRRRLLIFGASGHGRVVADAARAGGWDLVGWADEDPAKGGLSFSGAKVLFDNLETAAERALQEDWQVVVGIGDNRVRQRCFQAFAEAGVTLATVVHPRAVVAPSASVMQGTVIFAGAVINPDSRIGANVIVNTAASADHDNVLEDHCHLSPGVHLGGGVTVGEGTHLGVGTSVIHGARIGAWSTIGAGSVVVRDLPGRVVAYGVPARVMKEKG